MQRIHSETFHIVETTVDIEDAGQCQTFGVSITSEDGGELLRVEDISTLRPVVEHIVDLCVRNELAPEHFLEFLEDFWGMESDC